MSDIALAAYAKVPGAEPAVALILNGQVFDLQEARKAGLKLDEAWAENSVPRIVAQWTRDTQALKSASAELAFLAQSGALKSVPDGARKLTAPYRPDRIFCAASNYIEHANEMGTVLAAKAESKPYMFLKLRNTVIGPGADIQMPPETSMLDWEIELAAVIGKGGRRIPAASALDHVAGYSIVNDISARDLNVRNDYPFKFDWFQGKCHDTFAPFGPTIVPAWAIADPQNVAMELKVNGQIMQSDTTANMIWTLREQIAYISTIVTLEPGDVIATGTPTGVGMGRDIYLKAGDVVSASIAVIGTLTNTVRAEKV